MSFSQGIQRSSSTNCNVWWMQQPRSDRHQEVRPRLDVADAWQSPLAWRAWAHQVQSHHLDSSQSHRYRAWVIGILLPIVFRFPRWHRDVIYAPPLIISLSCRRTVSLLMWPSGVFCTRSETVELPAYRLLRDTIVTILLASDIL